MSEFHSLLPLNASELERALEEGMAQRIEALDAEAPARFHRPATLPVAHLPFLGWEMDVPLWKNLSAAERRALIAQSPDLHRLAGTLSGAKRLASWAGGEVIRAVTRRNRAFAGPTLTAAEREDWLTRLPEMRLYLARQRAVAASCTVLTGRVAPKRRFTVQSTALSRLFERVTLFRHGVEVDLSVWTMITSREQRSVITTRRVAMPACARDRWRFAARCLRQSSASSRLYTVDEQVGYIHESSVLIGRILPIPGDLNPVKIGFDLVAQGGQGQPLRHAGSILRGQQLTPSTARDRLYQRARLADPAITPAARGRGAYMTRSRLSPPIWRAELLTGIPKPLHARAALRFMRGHTLERDSTRLESVKYAIEWGRPAAAVWRIDPRTRVMARAGIHLAGTLRAGQTIATR